MNRKLNCSSYFQYIARNYKAAQIITKSFIVRSFLLITMLSGCAPPSIEATRVGHEMRKSQSETSAGILKDAVFSVVKEMTTAEAATALSSDGATCDNQVCYWTFTERESMWSPMRPPGLPLRIWNLRYQVEFTSQIIVEKANIVATVTSVDENSGFTLSESK